MYPRLILPFLFILPFTLFGQEISNDSLHRLAIKLSKQKKYSAADSLYKILFPRAKSENDFEEMAAINYDYAISLAGQRKFNEGGQLIKTTISEFREVLSESLELGRLYSLQGYFFNKQERFLDALEAYENSQKHYTKIDQYPINFFYSMTRAAQICTRTLDYDRALSFLRIAEQKDEKGEHKEAIFYSLTISYHYLEEFEKAGKYCMALLSMPDLSEKRKHLVYRKAAEIFLDLNKLEEAEKANFWLINHYNQIGSPSLAYPYSNLALLELKRANIPLAKIYYSQSLKAYDPYLESKDRGNSKYLANAGQFFEDISDLDRALLLYHQAMMQIFPNFNDTSIYAFPKPEEVGTESWMMSTARLKGQALYKKYQKTGDIKDLEAAGKSFQLFRLATENLRQTYGSDDSKIYLGQFLKADNDAAIQVFYELYQKSGEQKYLEEAYAIMERTKAVALSDAVIENKAFAFAKIPDSLLKAEKDLRQDIAEIKNDFVSASGEDKAELQKLLDSLNQEYLFLTDNIESQYPKFTKFQEGNRLLPIEEVQKYLGKHNGQLIEYYWGQRKVFAIILSGNDIQLREIGSTHRLIPQIQPLLLFLSDRSKIENEPNKFGKQAAELYPILLTGIDVDLNGPLWIIPDGRLHFLPFECLLTESPEGNIQDWPYLVNKKSIAYAYSITANFRAQTQQKAITSLAMAPVFENGERNLAPLKYSVPESNTLLNLMPMGDLFTDKEANLETFKAKAQKADILHLSTHAHVAPIPQIEFYDQSLSLEQLYGLDIPAQLVVLSACQTSMGNYEQGEGVMSLARGFFYSGASSLLSSLWTVNESSTATLIEYFYQHLGEGESSAEALQKAKIDYLKDPNIALARKSPYYWAGFVYIGPQLKPYQSSIFSLKNMAIVAVLMLGSLFIFRYVKGKT